MKGSMNLINFIWGFVRKQGWIFACITILSLLWTFEMLFWPFFLRKMVDVLTSFDSNRLLAWPQLKVLFVWGALSFFFYGMRISLKRLFTSWGIS